MNILQTDIYEKYHHLVNIIIIYIDEAHGYDVWPIGGSAGVYNLSHKCIGDRLECAINFKTRYDYTIPIYLDNMNNDFKNIYSVWPFRAFLINKKK